MESEEQVCVIVELGVSPTGGVGQVKVFWMGFSYAFSLKSSHLSLASTAGHLPCLEISAVTMKQVQIERSQRNRSRCLNITVVEA